MNVDFTLLPFKPAASDWPLAPLYVGVLSPDQLSKLIQSRAIEVDDSKELEEALARLKRHIRGEVGAPRQTIAYQRYHPKNPIHSADQLYIIRLGLDERINHSHEQVRSAYLNKLQTAKTAAERSEISKQYDYLCNYYGWVDDQDPQKAIDEFLKRFSYRLYQQYPVDDAWKNQTEQKADCFSVKADKSDRPATVRRLFTHPFEDSPQSDLMYEMDKEGRITTHSLLTIDVAIFTRGDNNNKPSLHKLKFDQKTLNITSTTSGAEAKFGDIEYVSQRHAAHFFGYQRALSSNNAFDYVPEDISDGPYILFEYVTDAEQRFVQYYDQRQQYLFHSQIYHPDKYRDDTPEELAERFGYKRLYKCDVIVPKGKKVTAWAGNNSRAEFTYSIDVDRSFTFPNQIRLVPTDHSKLKGEQKQRYEKAEAIFESGHYSYQGIVDLYNPEADANNSSWLILLALAYSNPRDKFFDEQKAYDLQIKAAELGSATASYNLGVNWANGLFGRVDIEKAKAWYLRAFNEDDADAGLALFNILRKDPRYKDPASQNFKNETDEVYARAKKLSDSFGRIKLARACGALSGTTEQHNPQVGFTLLEELASSTPIDNASPVYALFNLAQRHYLGLDVPRDIKKAQEYLDKIPKDKGDLIVKPQIRNAAEKLRQMISDEQSPAQYAARALKDRQVVAPPPPPPPAPLPPAPRPDTSVNRAAKAAVLAPSLPRRAVSNVGLRWAACAAVVTVAAGVYWSGNFSKNNTPPTTIANTPVINSTPPQISAPPAPATAPAVRVPPATTLTRPPAAPRPVPQDDTRARTEYAEYERYQIDILRRIEAFFTQNGFCRPSQRGCANYFRSTLSPDNPQRIHTFQISASTTNGDTINISYTFSGQSMKRATIRGEASVFFADGLRTHSGIRAAFNSVVTEMGMRELPTECARPGGISQRIQGGTISCEGSARPLANGSKSIRISVRLSYASAAP